MPHNKPDRLHGLDTLRAIAIAIVMLFHAYTFGPAAIHPVASFGWMGVDLFFVLSGYLIGTQLLRPYARGQSPSLLNFYWRRSIRVLPAYWVVLALYFLWPAWSESPHLSAPWHYLTFTFNLFVDYARNHAFSHVWSLCVEEQFYLVLPLLAILLFRKSSLRKTLITAALVIAIGIATRSWAFFHVLRPMGPDNDLYGVRYIENVYYPTWARMDGLLAGVLLAACQAFRPQAWQRLLRNGTPLFAASVLCIALSCWLFHDRFESTNWVAATGTIVGYPILALGLAALTLSAIGNGPFGRWRIPGASTIATLAYSLYLTHKEILNLCGTHLPARYSFETWTGLAIFITASLLVASTLYLLVEKPILKLRDRHTPTALEFLRDPAL